MKKPWMLALAAVALFVLGACNDSPRKEISDEDVCKAYADLLDKVMKDPKMTDQDRINMIPRLSGYGFCKDKVGTGGLIIPGSSAPGAPPSSPGAADAAARAKSAQSNSR